MSKSSWNANSIPDQSGKTIIITGASSGLGKEATRVLAQKQAHVIMAVRNTAKAEKVKAEILQTVPTANLEIQSLDLSSLSSVKTFSEEVLAEQKLNHR